MKGQVIDTRLATVNRVAWELGEARGPAKLVDAAMVMLSELFGGDITTFNQVDSATGQALMRVYPDPVADVTAALAENIADHPVVAHYQKRPGEMRPVRLGDLVADREWLKSPMYAEVFRPWGVQRQVAIQVTPPEYPLDGLRACAYATTRSGRDFGDDVLELATALQPALLALHRAAEVDLSVDEEREAARDRAGLTARELQLLALVASGMTAQAIGRAERISPRTVRKHLEHVYAKLGRHDRLAAVDYARQLGLLAPVAGAARG